MSDIKDLLKPRYKVIADYPLSRYKVGDIINVGEDCMIDLSIGNIPVTSNTAIYPHLFKKLKWWEDRETNDMPKYVNHKLGGCFEVFKWDKNSHGDWVCDAGIGWFFMGDLLPATEAEYLNLKTNKGYGYKNPDTAGSGKEIPRKKVWRQ